MTDQESRFAAREQLDCPTPSQLEGLIDASDIAPEVLAHLARCSACGEFLRNARFERHFAAVMAGDSARAARVDESGTRPIIPGYRVESEISRGGQGVVYEATHLASGRHVAIKVLHPSRTDSPSSRARFTREIRIVAALDHPGIVRLLDSMSLGDGRDALIMELVRGVSLSQWLGASPRPDAHSVARVLAEVAEAVDHAHKRGVVHRDIKPSNILIQEQGTARVLDFGVARWADPQSQAGMSMPDLLRITMTGEFTGTLAYAAPEQVGAQPLRADARSDVYSLGIIGYEAISGRLPYPVHGSLESTIANIMHAEPARLSKQDASLDLWTILAKAMAKEPSRRYQSAGALARDLRALLAGEAIDARRDSTFYVLRKSVRRNRFWVSIVGLGVVATLTVLTVLAVSNARLGSALRESTIERVRTLAALGSRAKAEELLWPALEPVARSGRDPSVALWEESFDSRKVLWTFCEVQSGATCAWTMKVGDHNPHKVGFDDRGTMLLGYRSGRVDAVDLASRRITTVRQESDREANDVALTPDGRHLLTVHDRTLTFTAIDKTDAIATFEAQPEQTSTYAHGIASKSICLAISSDGRIDAFTIPQLTPLAGFPRMCRQSLAWIDTDGTHIAYMESETSLRVMRVDQTGEETTTSIVPEYFVAQRTNAYNSHPLTIDNERTLAVSAIDSRTFVKRLGTSEPPMPLPGGPDLRAHPLLDPSGRLLMISSWGDSRLRLWDTATWTELPSLPGHEGAVSCFGTTPGGKQVYTIDTDGTLRLWHAPGHTWRRAISMPSSTVHDFALTSNAVIASGGASTLVAYSASSRDILMHAPAHLVAATQQANPSRLLLASAGLTGPVLLPGASPDQEPRDVFITPDQRVQSLRFGHTNGVLAACTLEGYVALIDPDRAAILASRELSYKNSVERTAALRWSNDDRSLVIASRTGHLHVLESATLSERHVVQTSQKQLRTLALLKDAYACAGDDGTIAVVDAKSLRVRTSGRISEDSLFALAWQADGLTLAVGDRAGNVFIVDAKTLLPLASFSAGGAVMALDFDRDGTLVVAALNRPIERWNFAMLAATLQHVHPAMTAKNYAGQ